MPHSRSKYLPWQKSKKSLFLLLKDFNPWQAPLWSPKICFSKTIQIFGAQPPFSLVTRESCRENEGLVVTAGWLPNPSFSCTVPTPPTRPLSRPVTRPRLPIITHHPAHMCLRHLPTQSNFHLVQHRSFHATPGIFHPKREESANRYENGAEHCLVLGWFFERQNSQVFAPHVGSYDVLMPSPSPQFFALTVVPKSKYPKNDVILRHRVGKKYFSDQNIWLRLSFAPACPRFQNAQRFFF